MYCHQRSQYIRSTSKKYSFRGNYSRKYGNHFICAFFTHQQKIFHIMILCLPFLWVFKWALCVKVSLQISQPCGLFFSWTASMCFFKTPLVLKDFWQIGQLTIDFPSWTILTCFFISPSVLKYFSHSPHLYGFLPAHCSLFNSNFNVRPSSFLNLPLMLEHAWRRGGRSDSLIVRVSSLTMLMGDWCVPLHWPKSAQSRPKDL